MSMFEKATRMKLRFNTPKGVISVEDVWDLPLLHRSGASLDDLAKALNRQLKDAEEESFVTTTSKSNEAKALQLRFDIVKHIIGVKMGEAEKARDAKAKLEKKQQILAAMANKEAETLQSASLDDLQKMLDEL